MQCLLSLVMVAAGIGQVEAEEPLGPTDRAEQLRFFKEKAGELSLFSSSDLVRPLPLKGEPVLRYSNSEREIGSLDGATFLWLEGARPMAAVSYSIRRMTTEAYRECTSLSEAPLVCRRDQAAIWAPKSGGLLDRKLAVASAPAAGKVQRLTQMRQLARQFSATCYHPRTEAPTELRLLPQPLYRYADEGARIVDGGLFCFVVANDPELFLRLEAIGEAASEAQWQYSLARMSSHKLAVHLDGKEIWQVSNYWQDRTDDRKTGPYVEAKDGVFNPAADAP